MQYVLYLVGYTIANMLSYYVLNDDIMCCFYSYRPI